MVARITGVAPSNPLGEIEEILGDREIAVGRELTKLFEEVVRGRTAAVRAALEAKEPRGEYVIAIGGREEEDD